MLIGDLIRRRALSSPQRIFWEEGRRRWRYDELDSRSEEAGRALRAGGLSPGDAIALCAGNGFPYACATFAAAKAALVTAHLHARLTANELHARLRHSQARVLFFGAEQAPAVAGLADRPETLRLLVRLPAEGAHSPLPPGAVDWADWVRAGPTARPLPSLEEEAVSPEAPFQLLYTSGTTGAPKGALISHRAKLRQAATHVLNLGLVPGDRVLSALPLSHQFAQWLVLTAVPLAGATVVARPRFDPAAFLEALAGEAVTHLPAVPTMLYRLLDAAPHGGAVQAPALRCIVYGGAPIAPERIPQLRRRFPSVRLFQGFGQTETGYCLGLHDEDHERRPGSLGRPDRFSRVWLADGQGREVPPGTVGEIVAESPYLMNGYHRDAEATARYFAFGRNRGRTGDLAFRDEEGYFTGVGRMDDVVVSGGVNLYPGEVEAVLKAHPGVFDAAVFGLPDPEWGEVLVAAVVARAGHSPGAEALDGHCRAALAGFKCPRRYLFLDDLPRTHSGKVQKHRLRQQAPEKPRSGAAHPSGSEASA